MKVCVFGAGAIGGFIAAHLAADGVPVQLIARGATLAAVRQHGLRLEMGGRSRTVQVAASDAPCVFGVQDILFLAVKAPSLDAVARQVQPLIGPHTTIVSAMNGVPWWFFHKFGGACEGLQLHSADPLGNIAAALPASQLVGCVVWVACSTPAPGVVRHAGGTELVIGAPDGGDSERVRALAGLLEAAGLDAIVSRAIQTNIWFKLWGNMTINPISALTGAMSDSVLADPLVERFSLDVMQEAARIGERIGCSIMQSGAARNAQTRAVPPFKSSMLQDVEAGRPVEIDALLGTVREIGQRVQVATPHIDILLGLARLHARARGLYPTGVRS